MVRHAHGFDGLSRIGYGAAKLTGPGIWGYPDDREGAIDLLRQGAELGVTFFDMADSYGPFVAEELAAAALHPYRGITIATKAGCILSGPDRWSTFCRADYLRFCCEMSLRRLRVDTIDLFYLHEVDRSLPLEEQVGALEEFRHEGKIRRIGLSNVDLADIAVASTVAPISAIQNEYNVLERRSEPVVERCAAEGLLFVPCFPLADGRLASDDGPLAELAKEQGCTPAQLAIAWLLSRPGQVVPIPGASSPQHLRDNLLASEIDISQSTRHALEALYDGVRGPELSGEATRS